jgi:hypothetical protein
MSMNSPVYLALVGAVVDVVVTLIRAVSNVINRSRFSGSRGAAAVLISIAFVYWGPDLLR